MNSLKPIDELRAKARAGDDVDFMVELRELLQEPAMLRAAVWQVGIYPYGETEMMLLRVIGSEFGKQAEPGTLEELLSWFDELPEGLGKVQTTMLLLEIQKKDGLDFLARNVLPERSKAPSGNEALLFNSALTLMQSDPGAYFLPVIEAAHGGSEKSRDVLLESLMTADAFNYNRSMVLLEGESPYGDDPAIREAAILGLGNAADEHAKNYLLEIYRDNESPDQEAAFESLRIMESNTPGLFNDSERAEFLDR